MDHRTQEWRNPDPHELAEYMAERQRVQNPERMKGALKLEILLHLAFDGAQAREHVVMSVDHPLGLSGGARSKDNLQRVIFA